MLFRDNLNVGSRVRWLLGETLVIVLGVLIALGIDDFWSERQEQQLELQYLRRIHAEVNADRDFIENFIDVTVGRKLAALDAIAPVVRGQEPLPVDVESFLRNVALGGLGGVSASYWAQNATFEDMKSTGNLRLIQDASLRSSIARYYYDFEQLRTRSSDRTTRYAEFVHSVLPAELRNDLDLEAMERFGVDRALDRFISSEFQDLLNQEYNYAYFVRQNIDSSAAIELIASLEAEMMRLER